MKGRIRKIGPVDVENENEGSIHDDFSDKRFQAWWIGGTVKSSTEGWLS